TLGLAMACHMFESGKHLAVSERQGVALKSTHRPDSQLAHEIGVLAVSFLDPTPAWVASYVDNRCQHQLHATRADFPPGNRENASQQRRVPRARERNRLRKAGRIPRGIAMQPFLVEQRGNAQPRFFYSVVLNGVHQRDSLAGIAERVLERVAAGSAQVTRPRDMPDAGREHLA